MDDDLETILQRVADGELTPDEAEPMIADATGRPVREDPEADERRPYEPSPTQATIGRNDARARRAVRLQVTESGRSVVDLRIPMNLASLAGSVVPGLANAQMERIREAIRAGEVGPVLEIRDEDGDGVIISTE